MFPLGPMGACSLLWDSIEKDVVRHDVPISISGLVTFIAVYHDFESSEDVADGFSSDFGSEIDVALTKKFSNGATLQLKYADFSGEEDAAYGNATSDVSKLWFTATYAI